MWYGLGFEHFSSKTQRLASRLYHCQPNGLGLLVGLKQKLQPSYTFPKNGMLNVEVRCITIFSNSL